MLNDQSDTTIISTTASEADASPAIKTYTLHDNWAFRQKGTDTWRPAVVPGCNFSDLLRHDLIPDPFYRTNEEKVQWIEREDWSYRTEFHCSEEDMSLPGQMLEFAGLDTFAEVYLNGTHILTADNMFRTWTVPVQGVLVAGINELEVEFVSPLVKAAPQAAHKGFIYPAGNDHSAENLSVFCRKAPYHFGWDWGPRLVTSGIWRPVKLHLFAHTRVAHTALSTVQADENGGRIQSEWEVDALHAGTITLHLNLGNGRWAFSEEVSVEEGHNRFTFTHTLPGAERWWPVGEGEPVLYRVERTVADMAGTYSLLAEQFGLRTVQLIREPDADGHSYYFKVNGRPVFMKGANYIPQDNLLDRVGEPQYQKLFADTLAANMNMLRVWGGGIYEDDRFYQLANQYGILIWQDFMFACTLYPGEEDFLASVREEAIDNIKRLKQHPSLALWCGNNEIAVGRDYWGWPEDYGYTAEQYAGMREEYARLFETLLPQLVKEYDPTLDYVSTSPLYDYSQVEHYQDGDVHYWGVWHEEEPFVTYLDHIPRFMSEYGFQSFPTMPSVRRYTQPEDWSIDSAVMQLHQKHPRGNGIIKKYLLQEYREPVDFASFLYLSQVLQAKGIRMAIEAHRAAKPFCMGTLYWQLNDCWPVASWSGIDYYGRWKALHYAVRQAYQETIIAVRTEQPGWTAHLVTDKPGGWEGTCRIQYCDLQGQEIARLEQPVSVNREAVARLSLADLEAAFRQKEKSGGGYLRARLLAEKEVIYDHVVFPDPIKEVSLPAPHFTWEAHEHTAGTLLTVQSTTLIKNLYLWLDKQQVHFSDNFFDLLPGEPRNILVSDISAADFRSAELAWTSVYQTYQK
mgnify:CR=1 FL=1